MSWFRKQLQTVGETMDSIAGVSARYLRGETEISIVCVPVRIRPEYLAENVAIRMELQDFYLFREQLNGLFPQADDKILIDTETFQIIGGTRKMEGVSPVEVLGSDGKRLLVHAVRVKK